MRYMGNFPQTSTDFRLLSLSEIENVIKNEMLFKFWKLFSFFRILSLPKE